MKKSDEIDIVTYFQTLVPGWLDTNITTWIKALRADPKISTWVKVNKLAQASKLNKKIANEIFKVSYFKLIGGVTINGAK